MTTICHRRAVSLVLAAVAVLVGCGSPSDDSSISSVTWATTAAAPVERHVVFVLDASPSMGGSCFHTDVPAPTPEDPSAFERVWDCSQIEGDNAEGAPTFRAAVEAMARVIESSVPLDGSVAVTVVVATAGQVHLLAGDAISYDGPLTPIMREVVRTQEQRTTLAARVRTITQPRVTRVAGTPPQCGFSSDLGIACPPFGGLAWGVHQATQALTADTAASRRGLCIVGDVDHADFVGDIAAPSVIPPSTPEDRFMGAAIVEAHFVAGIERTVIIQELRESVLADFSAETLRVVEVEGIASLDGDLELSFFHTLLDGGGRGPALGTLSVPLEIGTDRYITAQRIAQAVTASTSLENLEAAAYGPFLVLHKITANTGGLANPWVEADGDIGLQLRFNRLATELDREVETDRANIVRNFGALTELVFTRAESDIPDFEIDVDRFETAIGNCLAPRVRIRAMEVTQGLQDWRNTLPLVEGRRTMVRVQTRFGDFSMGERWIIGPGVMTRLRLHGSQCATGTGTTCESPMSLGSLEGKKPDYRSHYQPSDPFGGQDISPPMANLAEGPGQIFELPPSWRHGRVELTVERTDGAVECATATGVRARNRDGVDGRNECSVIVEFDPQVGPPIHIQSVPLGWLDSTGNADLNATKEEIEGSQELSAAMLPLNFDTSPVSAYFTVDEPFVLRATVPRELSVDYDYDLPDPEIDGGITRAALSEEILWETERDALSLLSARWRRFCSDPSCVPTTEPTIIHGVLATYAIGSRVSLTDRSAPVFVEHMAPLRGTEMARLGIAFQSHAPHEVLHVLGRFHVPYCAAPVPLCAEHFRYDYSMDPRGDVGPRPALGPLTNTFLRDEQEDLVANPVDQMAQPISRSFSAAPSLRGQIMNPWRTWDIMSYCGNDEGGDTRWMSSQQMFGLLRDGSLGPAALPWFRAHPAQRYPRVCDPAGLDSEGRVCGSGGAAIDLCREELPLEPGTLAAVDLRVSFSVTPDGIVTLDPLFEEVDSRQIPAPTSGAYLIRMRDVDGATVSETLASPMESDGYGEREGPDIGDLVAATVLRDPRNHRVVVLRDGVVIASRTASATWPTVVIGPPIVDVAAGELRWSWIGSDADGDALAYSVEYARDGVRFVPIAENLTGENIALDLARMPGGSGARLRVSVMDGFHTSRFVSSVFDVPGHPPSVTARKPTAGEHFFPGQTIVLDAIAMDLEDGSMLATDATWSSDRAGALTLAEDRISVGALAPGLHRLTGTFRDSSGLVGSAEIEITIESQSAELVLPDVGVRFETRSVDGVSRPVLVLRNHGVVPVSALALEVSSSDGTPNVEGLPSGCVSAGQVIRCTGIAVPVGSVVEFVIALAGATAPSVDLTASITVPDDRDPGNDGARTTVLRVPPAPSASLTIEIDGPRVRGPGHWVARVLASNLGDVPAIGPFAVQISFTAPVGATVLADGDGWACSHDGSLLFCANAASRLASGMALPPIFVDATWSVPAEEDAGAASDAGSAVLDGGGIEFDSGTPAFDAGPLDATVVDWVDVVAWAGDIRAVDRHPELANPGFPLTTYDAALWYQHYYPFRPGRTNLFLRYAYGGVDYGDGLDGIIFGPPVVNHVWRQYTDPVQGASWQYDVYLRNQGNVAASGPIVVETRIPPGMRFSPEVAQTGTSSVPAGWACALSDDLLTCTRAEGLPAAQTQGVTLPILLNVELDAERVQPLDVVVRSPVDIVPGNNEVHDRLHYVRQPWGPTMPERADYMLPESGLAVAVAPSSGEVVEGSAATATFQVTNPTSAALAAGTIELRIFDAPVPVLLSTVEGSGWTCGLRWGSATCSRPADTSMLAVGGSLPPVLATFTAGPAETTNTLQITAAVRTPGERLRRSAASIQVTRRAWAYSGTLAYIGCPGEEDCQPLHHPETTSEGSRLPQLQLLDLDRRERQEVTWEHTMAGDDHEWWSSEPTFSPMGNKIAVVDRRWTAARIVEVDLTAERAFDGSYASQVVSETSGKPFISVDYAPNGDSFVETFGNALYLGSNTGGWGGWIEILHPTFDHFLDTLRSLDWQPARPAFSPDGLHVVFQRGTVPQLWILDVEQDASGSWIAGEPRRLTATIERRETSPAWSPDGRSIAFSADGRITLFAIDSGSEFVVTDGGKPGEADGHPTFSPDGGWIAFERSAPEAFAEEDGFRDEHFAHRVLIQGPIFDRPETAILVVSVGGGAPALLARGRHPNWGASRPDPFPEVPLPSPSEPATVGPEIRVDTPADGAVVPLGAPIEIVGSVAADISLDGPVQVLAMFDQGGLPAPHRRSAGAGMDRLNAVGVPQDWRVIDPAPPACAGLGPLDLAQCQTISLERSLQSVPGVEVALLSFGDDLLYRSTIPGYLPNVFMEDIGPGTGMLGDDDASDGIPDFEQAVQSIETGVCGDYVDGGRGRAIAFSLPGNGTVCRHTGAWVGRNERAIRTYDDALVEMNAHFRSRAPGRRIAYIVSSGREHVSDDTDSPLGDAIRDSTVVHAFARAAQPRSLDVLVLVDERLGSGEAALGPAMRRLSELATSSTYDVHVMLVSASDHLTGTPLAGDPRYTYLPHTFGDPGPIQGLHSIRSSLAAWQRPGAALQVLLASGDGRGLEPYYARETLNMVFSRPFELHVIAPEGRPGRPSSVPCSGSGGFTYYGVADWTRGTKTSICADDFTAAVDAVFESPRIEPTDDCADPTSALRKIADATGGQCTTIDWATQAPAVLPWAERDGRDHVVSVVVDAAGVSVPATMDGSGRFRATLSAGLPPGTTTVNVRSRTERGLEATASIVVRTNHAPVAVDDTVADSSSSGFVLFNILGNDSDPDGDALSVADYTPTSRGAVACFPDGSCEYRYDPATVFDGTDSFTYTVRDNLGLQAAATVTIALDGNRPPIANDFSMRLHGLGSTMLDVLAHAYDPEGAPLQVLMPYFTSMGQVLCADSDCAYVSYATAGTDVFSYSVRDQNGLSATATITVILDESGADLRASIEAPLSAAANDLFDLSISIRNDGASPGSGAVVDFPLPFGLTFEGATGAGWSCRVSWSLVCTTSAAAGPGETLPPLVIRFRVPADAMSMSLYLPFSVNAASYSHFIEIDGLEPGRLEATVFAVGGSLTAANEGVVTVRLTNVGDLSVTIGRFDVALPGSFTFLGIDPMVAWFFDGLILQAFDGRDLSSGAFVDYMLNVHPSAAGAFGVSVMACQFGEQRGPPVCKTIGEGSLTVVRPAPPPCTPSQYQSVAQTEEIDQVCMELTICTTGEFESVPPTATTDRVCSTLTTCTASEYESTAPTASSDRLCAALTVCTSSQYESVPPTGASNRECLTLTVCTSSQYQSTAPTATTDRACSALTTCTSSQYQSTAPTATSDRECMALTTCMLSQYESVPPTVMSDRECSTLTVCTSSQYQSTAATTTSDRACSALTVCTSSHYQSTAPTATSDRVCSTLTTCTANEYESTAPTASRDRLCTALTACTSSQFQSTAPTATSDRECMALTTCTSSQYQSTAATATSDRECSTLTVCSSSQFQSTAPTATSDRGCSALTACTSSQYQSTASTATSDRECTALTRCMSSQYESVPPTEMGDRECTVLTACTSGQYQSTVPTATSDRECTALTNCTSGQYQSTAPTATSDRECTALTTCTSSQYQSTAPTATSDRECTVLTACTAGQYQSTAPTTTSDRACTALTTCTASQYQSIPPTAASDRVCTALTVCTAGQYEAVPPTATSDRVCAVVTTCTHTQGYWKNHASAWPVTTLTLGDEMYRRSQALALLRTSPRGDASLILAHQLIAALLSGGAADPTITAEVAAAQRWMSANADGDGRVPYGTRMYTAHTQATALAEILERYNSGEIGPGHCP